MQRRPRDDGIGVAYVSIVVLVGPVGELLSTDWYVQSFVYLYLQFI